MGRIYKVNIWGGDGFVLFLEEEVPWDDVASTGVQAEWSLS